MNQSMKGALYVALMIAALAVAYSVVVYANTYSQSIGQSARSFSVSGDGSVTAVPDIAEFTFGVLTEGGSNLTALQNENASQINKVVDFLKSNGVDDEDIKTQNLNINPRYQYSSCRGGGVCPPPQIVGYTINQSVRVKVRDLNNVGQLFAGVVDNGANTASNLQFTIDDTTEFENEARAEAIEEAERRAEATADAAGFRIGKLLSISEFGNQPPVYYGIGGDADVFRAESVAPTIEPGTEEITITVNLFYEIK